MYTIAYKGLYINGYCHTALCAVAFQNGGSLGYFPSLLSAKRAITKYLKQGGTV